MPRAKEANQRLREEQRGKILEAARRVFARKGMAATMDDVAAEAGVSHGLAYRYFANKEALFQALVEQALQSGPAILWAFDEALGTPGERLAVLITDLMESRRDHPEIYQLLEHVQSAETTPDSLRKLFLERGMTFRGVLRQLIVEGQATGEVAAGNPDQLVMAVAACLNGVTRLAWNGPEQFKEQCPDAEIILRMLKPCPGQK
jgi:AcrR family transcriptional regulator